MSTRAKPEKKPRKPRSPEAPPPPLPAGTEVMLGPKEAAAALGLKPDYFNQQVRLGLAPKPDGTTPWGRRNFWRQSTINAFIAGLSKARDEATEQQSA